MRLKFKQHLQRALRNFWLIGRIRRQEFAALDQVIHACRHMMLIRARAEEEGMVTRHQILPRQL